MCIGYFEKYGELTGTQSRLRDLAELLGHAEDRTGPNLRGDEGLSIPGSPRSVFCCYRSLCRPRPVFCRKGLSGSTSHNEFATAVRFEIFMCFF